MFQIAVRSGCKEVLMWRIDTEHLIASITSNDRGVYETAFTALCGELRRAIGRFVAPTDSDDIVQEALLVIARKFNRRLLQSTDPILFERWCIRILINCKRNHFRKWRVNSARFTPIADYVECSRKGTVPVDRILSRMFLIKTLRRLDSCHLTTLKHACMPSTAVRPAEMRDADYARLYRARKAARLVLLEAGIAPCRKTSTRG